MKSLRERRLKQPESPDGTLVRLPAAFSVVEVNTASWRLERPVCDVVKCVKCKICERYCPLQAIEVGPGGPQFDLAYCKGCGICANECPKQAILMQPEIRKGGSPS